MRKVEGIVITIKAKCRRCYTCIRYCPAKAIKVEEGQAKVMPERCIACGNCIRVCTQAAKMVESAVETVDGLLQGPEPVVACLAPSFPASFYPLRPGQVVAALRAMGFQRVFEVAFGAQLVAREYSRLARRSQIPIITTPCPALVAFVEKYHPSLVPYLAPIVSPMIALGRVIKQKLMPNARAVFIGPCVAKKAEIKDEEVAGAIDAVLTYAEIKQMFGQRGLVPSELPDSSFDEPVPGLARIFPVSGGLLRSAAIKADILENDILVTEGRDNCLSVLRELSNHSLKLRFLDILFCEGCIDGPLIDSSQPFFSRKEIVTSFVKQQISQVDEAELERVLDQFADVSLARHFADQGIELPIPTEEDIQEIFRRINKYKREDELNCGACGYPTCRDKAIAVYQGLAEAEMCLPYLIDQLQQNLSQLESLHRQLQSAQDQLVQSEKLASMGQLAAGVAHELNNPLGSILIYSHLLERELAAEGQSKEDLRMIMSEAVRCKEIVSGLLDFARQKQVIPQATDVNKLVEDSLARVELHPALRQVQVIKHLDPDLPPIYADARQLVQVFVNLFTNAGEAMPQGGQLIVTTERSNGGVKVIVEDTGCGIPEENLARLFTPFFTTKKQGKGTGLGLAIAYGIIKMHRGSIDVKSQVGKGTTFTVSLPLAREGNGMGQKPALIG